MTVGCVKLTINVSQGKFKHPDTLSEDRTMGKTCFLTLHMNDERTWWHLPGGSHCYLNYAHCRLTLCYLIHWCTQPFLPCLFWVLLHFYFFIYCLASIHVHFHPSNYLLIHSLLFSHIQLVIVFLPVLNPLWFAFLLFVAALDFLLSSNYVRPFSLDLSFLHIKAY